VFTPNDTVDYSSATTSVSLVVSPAPLTVTANSMNRSYGQPNPVFTGFITGVTNGDNITADFVCSATTNSPSGAYPIQPVLIDPNNRLGNYTVTTNNGVLTIVLWPQFQTIYQLGPELVFTWNASTGGVYQLQYKTDLAQTNWIDLGDPITAASGTVSATDTMTNSQKFYRLEVLTP
jgi:hypothetical protein